MGHRSNRREFIKILSGAAVAPSLLRGADAVGSALGTAQGPLGANLAPKAPIGVGKGIHPGRVVWAHDPGATPWEGPGHGHWWESEHTNQDVVEKMMSGALRKLTGKTSDQEAWRALFKYFNHTSGHGNAGYQKGEKINIKVNMVGCLITHKTVDPQSYDLVDGIDYMNASPQMIGAVLRQLVDAVGVKQEDIYVGDPLALFPNQYVEPLRREFPGVHYVDHNGGSAEHPRTKVQYSSIPFYWSSRPPGMSQDFVPVHYAESKYLINLANLKCHEGAGVTLCAKNHFGSLIRKPPDKGYYNLHEPMLGKALESTGRYRPVVDLMGHAHAGGKTLLYLVDGLYPGIHGVDHSPQKWTSAPFNGRWASSLLASQDPVAIDSVGFDFLWTEWNHLPLMPRADDYLHEAALADNPPSGTFYDSDHPTNTTRLASLGVHEHWNNPQEKLYSKNLGKNEGVELIRVGPKAA